MSKKNKIDYDAIAKSVLELVGGDSNVESFTNCQTRLRINVRDVGEVNQKELTKTQGALGINISGTQVQVIYGPGKVVTMKESFGLISKSESKTLSLEEQAKINKAAAKSNNTSGFQKFVGKFAGIFAPLIIGFIGAGILAGIAGIIQSSGMHLVANKMVWKSDTAHSWFNIFNVLLTIWKGTFLVIVGWRTSEAFGGSGVIGAIIAGLYVTAFAGAVDQIFIPIKDSAKHTVAFNFLGTHISGENWFLKGLRPAFSAQKGWAISYPSGSIFGVMFSAGLVGIIEKRVRRIVPNVLDTVLTPTFTLIILLALNIILIFPISGYVFTAVAFLFKNLYGNPIGAALLGGIFLITVVFGIHQGFVPVYAALLAETGVNGLFPVLAMAGAGQVGMALALYLRAEKNGVLRAQIKGAIIPGILGIGEPLIYGVSLPRVKPFITACIGGAVGGFFIGAINLWGGDPVGLNTMFGPSGIIAIPLMTTAHGVIWKAILVYMGGLAISYAAGFVATYYFGHKGVDLA